MDFKVSHGKFFLMSEIILWLWELLILSSKFIAAISKITFYNKICFTSDRQRYFLPNLLFTNRKNSIVTNHKILPSRKRTTPTTKMKNVFMVFVLLSFELWETEIELCEITVLVKKHLYKTILRDWHGSINYWFNFYLHNCFIQTYFIKKIYLHCG